MNAWILALLLGVSGLLEGPAAGDSFATTAASAGCADHALLAPSTPSPETEKPAPASSQSAVAAPPTRVAGNISAPIRPLPWRPCPHPPARGPPAYLR